MKRRTSAFHLAAAATLALGAAAPFAGQQDRATGHTIGGDRTSEAASDASGSRPADVGMTGGATAWGSRDVGQVEVDISHLAKSLAGDLQLDRARIPDTVRVPSSLAANVCGVDIDVLLQQQRAQGTVPTCIASTATAGLKHAVMQQVEGASTVATRSGRQAAGAGGGSTSNVGDEPVSNLLQASQRLRDAVQILAQAPAGGRRDMAIRQANQALLEVQDATVALPPELLTAGADEGQYRRSVEELQRAAQRLRDAAQHLAEGPSGEERAESIREVNEALRQTNEAMLLAAASRTEGAGSAATAGMAAQHEGAVAPVPPEPVLAPTPGTGVQRPAQSGQASASGDEQTSTTTSGTGTPGATMPQASPAPADEAPDSANPARGQAPRHPGRVAVDIGPVAPNLAAGLAVSQAELPPTVWLPTGLAADVCGVPVEELTPPASQGTPACTANVASPELQEALRIELATPGQQLR